MITPEPKPTATVPEGWVLYDETCGFCRKWVPFWANTLRKRGFEIAPLQTDWVSQRLQAGENELLQDLRLVLADGGQVQGADVYRHAMRRIWWAYPLYLLSIAPPGKRIFNWGYTQFAAHRYEFSRACLIRNHPAKRS